jgi:hypothetical protein
MWVDLVWLADQMDELSQAWRDRVLPTNTLPHAFNASATGSLDTFPIRIRKPQSPVLNRLVYQGKYCFHCLKVSKISVVSLPFLSNDVAIVVVVVVVVVVVSADSNLSPCIMLVFIVFLESPGASCL